MLMKKYEILQMTKERDTLERNETGEYSQELYIMRRECKVRHDEEQEENKGAYISEGEGGQDDKATYMHDMHGR